ncbi:S49 family peptidase [Pseudoalteromonas rubra]|uniref:S49 family peptidase n=1 Tax=Pseudoalteromonas rubra TaxID=43658 RepID=UPI000F76670B|nr:S49 family peptidase [Pseudoalteromonas rubra]
MKRKLALNYLMAQPWALDQQLLSLMGDIANREVDSLSLDDLVPSSLAAKAGKSLTPGMEKRDGSVALIHVNGVISRYANLFTNICGGTTTQALAQDLTQALDDPAIKAIVFNCDSQGGEANGIHELAEMIYQARGKKRIVAYVGGMACSACYWIASACDEVVMDATATAGSIGTVLQIRRKKPSAEDEYETIEIVSSQSPNKRQDPGTKDGRAAYQAHLDSLAEVFVQRVARNMDVDRDTVIEEFGGGGILVGQAAVDKGMAHRLGSLEGVIAELKTGNKSNMADPNKTAASGKEGSVVTFSLPGSDELSTADLIATVTEQRPDVLEAIKGPSPAMAISHAADLVAACAKAGVPALSASVLKGGITKAEAERKITMVSGLKDTLAASGMSGSLDTLIACIDDPVKLVGQAIHESKAASDENGNQARHITEKAKTGASLRTKDIYAKR